MKGASKNTVEDWFAALSDEQALLLSELRAIILAVNESFVEEIKWGQPCYSLNKLVCYLQKAKGHITLGFQKGAHLDDPLGLLEGDGADMRHIRIQLGDKVDGAACAALLEAAVHFDNRSHA